MLTVGKDVTFSSSEAEGKKTKLCFGEVFCLKATTLEREIDTRSWIANLSARIRTFENASSFSQ